MADPAGNPGTDSGQGDVPKYVTEEQLNRAITARLTDFGKKQEKQFGEFSTGLTSKIEELIKATPPSPAAAEPKTSDDPLVKGLQKQLQDLQVRADKAASEAAAERDKARQSSLRQTLQEQLLSNGVDAARVKHAVGFLVDAEKRVRYQDGSEDLVFTDSDGTELDLKTGVRTWVSSDDGKFYLPPRGINGSGDRGTGNAPKSGKTQGLPTNATIGQQLIEAYG